MRPFRRLLSVLSASIASGFAQGSAGDEVLVRRLRERLGALRDSSRRARTSGALVLLACAGVLVAMPLVTGLATWQRGAASLLAAVVMLIAAAGVLEASKLLTLLGALEDLLMAGGAIGPMDVVLAFRDRVRAELSPEPDWTPLAELLSTAYDTPASVRMMLQQARVPVALIDMSQPVLHVWQDALRVAYRRERLEALLGTTESDPDIAAYHSRLRACRARLGV